ncbi:MAG: ATP phosphoribosyltransferase regulatory subunit [Gammaproteobacteria bacterium]
MSADRWLLPDGVEEALPARARALEALRRRLLDLYAGWGYELVMPPLIEFLDSLLCAAGPDVSLQTFRLTDQLSGRALGVRADITPQVARIDAHSLRAQGPQRLCYAGTVLHARPAGMAASRVPLQAGAELFGHAGIDADIEVISLMLETLAAVGRRDVHLDIGHVGIHRGLVAEAKLAGDAEAQLFDIFQRKAIPELDAFLAAHVTDAATRKRLRALVDLAGDLQAVSRQAKAALAGAGADVQRALDDVIAIAGQVRTAYPHVEVCVDLCELRGYRYHGGCVFAAYVAGRSQEVAKGGRYDSIGEAFGRARPATGFSVDVKTLLDIAADGSLPVRAGICAPAGNDADLLAKIARLRAAGERVVRALPGAEPNLDELQCDRVLVRAGRDWDVKPR